MPMLPASVAPTKKINAQIEKTIRKLGSDVVRVKYDFGEDSTGEPSVYFRVILTDASTEGGKLWETTSRVTDSLRDLHLLENWGLLPYYSFRTKSEQDELNDPAWG